MTTDFIYKDDVCNLSRIPVIMEYNPVYVTATQLQENNSIDSRDTELFNHYQNYNPSTLFDIYGVVDKLKEFPCNNIFLPWIHYRPVSEFIDVAFMYREEEFIEKQITKVKNLIDSIKIQGYAPEKFPDKKGGYITGYWLKHNEDKKFYVCSGNHRVSICFCLDQGTKIPFKYEKRKHLKDRDLANRRKDVLKIYDTKNASQWPSVTSGFLNVEEAILITKTYVRSNDE